MQLLDHQWWCLNNTVFVSFTGGQAVHLASEAVQGASLTLEGVHDVKGCDSLPTSVLCVCHSIPDHVLQEHLEHSTRLLVDEARNTLDTSTTSQTPDGGFCDSCRNA